MRMIFGFFILVASAVSAFSQDSVKPATAEQIRDSVDWNTIPQLPGASKIQKRFNHMSYEAAGSFEQAAAFYRQELSKLGWVEDTSVASDQKNYLSVIMEKNGFRLSVSGYRTKPEDPMMITLMNFGNVDVSRFPKASDAEVKTSNRGVVYYFSKQSTEDLLKFCNKFMTEMGWKEERNAMYDTWAKEGRFVLTFQQNAMQCTLSVVKKPDHAEVMYSSSVRHDLTASEMSSTVTKNDAGKPGTLKDAIAVIDIMKLPRMEKATKTKRQKEIVCLPIGTAYQVPDSLEDVVKFFREHLKKAGCNELTPMVETDSMAMLYFEKNGYLLHLAAQHDKKEGATLISLMNHGNVDLRKLPMPTGARMEPERYHYTNLTISLSVDEAKSFYRNELSKLGWNEVKRLGEGTLRFTQNAVELNLEIQKNTNDKTSVKLQTIMK